MISDSDMDELRSMFSDLINYGDANPLASIDPFLYKTPEGDSCLHIAAIRGDYRAVELLLSNWTDINMPGDMGNTALHYAASNRHRDIYQLLIAHGANAQTRNEFGRTAAENASWATE
jgi:ankyrin repeat protein